MTNRTRKDDVILWQEVVEGVPEPALLIEFFTDVITISQEGRYVQINYEAIKELTRVLKSRPKPE